MNRTIEIVVAPNGETHLETKGFSGATCQAASRILERLLGTPLSEQLTAEFHQESATRAQVSQGGAA